MKTLITSLSLIIFCLAAYAQTGFIRGYVFDESTGETLIGVTVAVAGTTQGTTTDLDGAFSLPLEPGKYNLQVSYVSFQTMMIEEVEVKSGSVTSLNNIKLKENTQKLGEVVIKAEVIRSNESGILSLKRKSAVMLDGISADKIELTGDGNAVQAAKRITGVTIEGGKYVYVRGLGDRYSKTTLNGIDIPGLDPDRNSLQMDIFPSNMIGNIMISKNFTADMPADFTGGLLNIETKEFPEEKAMTISASVGYNPQMHFNSNYLGYKGGKTDFLGFDDGTRALPNAADQTKIPSPLSGSSSAEVTDFVSSFSPTLGATERMSAMDFGLNFSAGNQIALGKDKTNPTGKKLGYTFSVAYKNETKFYDEVEFGEYQRYINPDSLELRPATVQKGAMGENNVLVAAIAGLAYKTQNTKLKLTLMHLQNGESRAAQFNIDNDPEAVGQSGYFAFSNNLEYNQRSMSNLLLNGTHVLGADRWEIDWRLSPTLSLSEDPDIRKTAFTERPLDTLFMAGAGGNPSRIWRSLNEISLAGRFDVSYKYRVLNRTAKLKFGVANTFKTRGYEILFFDMQFFGNQDWLSTDPNDILQPDNIYPNQPNSVYYQSGNNNPNPNEYQSSINNTGLYVSNEFDITSRLKTLLGVRMEYYVQRHTGRDQSFASGDEISGRNLENEKVLETINLFPSVNLIYQLAEKQNLRLSYSRTVARPSFKETSFAQIIDPITNRIFNGSLFEYSDWDGNLKETDIDNVDLRWELFMEKGQLVSVSLFYKRFANPIELVRIPEQQTSTEFQPRNVGTGNLYGVELEVRKNMGFISDFMANFYMAGNVTFVKSFIEMTDLEFNARKVYEKEGEDIKNKRSMAGQSPFVLNVGLGYSDAERGIDAGIFYNVKGPTLSIVGAGLFPDVYDVPFHSLNIGFNIKVGAEKNTVLDFKVANALNDKIESVYKSYKATDQIFSSLNPGFSFGVGVSHKF